jgi:hypothetical protein
MFLVSSFSILLQELAIVMTSPSFHNFTVVATGWVFAHRRTVTGMLMAAGQAGVRHHSAFHRFFSLARWSLDGLGLAVYRTLEVWLPEGSVLLALDDTLAAKRGLKVFGAGMHYDPQLSSRNKSITRWGHNWVIVGLIVRFPLWPERAFTLPILFRMYLNKKSAAKHRRVYRTRPELALEMLHMLCGHRKNRRFHAIADSAYGGWELVAHLPSNCDLTSRLVLNARLHEAVPAREGRPGRPRVRGVRMPTPEQMLQGRAAVPPSRPSGAGRSGGGTSWRTRQRSLLLHLLGSPCRADHHLVLVALVDRAGHSRQQAAPGLRGAARLEPACRRAYGANGHVVVQPDRTLVCP